MIVEYLNITNGDANYCDSLEFYPSDTLNFEANNGRNCLWSIKRGKTGPSQLLYVFPFMADQEKNDDEILEKTTLIKHNWQITEKCRESKILRLVK